MKKYFLFAAALFAVMATSCEKEITAKEASTLSDASGDNISARSLRKSKPKSTQTIVTYGALIGTSGNQEDAYNFEMGVAGELGLSAIRDKAPVPGTKKVKTLSSAYGILLNFTSVGAMPLLFRNDIPDYQQDLKNAVNALLAMPAVAVIENEESNAGYYNGTPEDYITQLKAAIPVMHSYGIPVANGGLTSTGLTYLVYQDILNRGLTGEAEDYKNYLHIALNSSFTLDRADFISVLLANYATMDLDYVNFHWRSQQPEDAPYLGQTIDYLKRITGKTVITNEIGQYDSDPETLTSTLDICKQYQLPYVSWYSCSDGRSYPLQNADGSLTATGYAYKNYIATGNK